MRTKTCVVTIVLLIACAQAAWAGTITLAWNANAESDVAGYKLHYGTSSRAYSQEISIAGKSVTSYTATLNPNTYYFALTAVDTSGNESGYSNEVSAQVSGTAPGKPGTPFLVQ
ncbi:MAG: fibronectin type III domain-containing protein [bacterium]